MSDATARAGRARLQLDVLPIGLFGAVMGHCCPFRVSRWAVSFPLAASAIAAARLDIAEPGIAVDTIDLLLLALASVVIAGLFARTLLGLVRGELRTLSG